jgi:hypothetical protein
MVSLWVVDASPIILLTKIGQLDLSTSPAAILGASWREKCVSQSGLFRLPDHKFNLPSLDLRIGTFHSRLPQPLEFRRAHVDIAKNAA